MNWFANGTAWLRRYALVAWQWVYRLVVPPYETRVVIGDLPPNLKRRTLYIVEEDGYREQAALLCPCGQGHILHLNLLPDERPCWRVSEHDDGTASLHPSVWRKKDCKSHFWLRRGRIFWVPDHR